MSAAVAKRSKQTTPAKQVWGQMSPEMRALPNDNWRAFCHALVTGPGGHGKNVAAYREAGFGKDSDNSTQAKAAYLIAHDDRMIAAVRAESLRLVRSGHPEAVNALYDIMRDVTHKDRARVAMAFLDRADPLVTRQDISVTHKIVDADQEALEEYCAAIQIGASHEKLCELFGGNAVPRLERMRQAAMSKRSDEAKIIDADNVHETDLEQKNVAENRHSFFS
jgi:hypothetical protein